MRIIFILAFSALCTSNLFAVDFSKYNSSLMLLVTKNNGRTFFCSSVAVSRAKLLTAAHCLANARRVRVLKEYKLGYRSTFYAVKSFRKYKKYNKYSSNYLYDIGIIEMKYLLPKTINYPTLKSLKRYREGLIRVGFGSRNDENVRTIISPLDHCDNWNNYMDCDDRYSVHGDSGGPIYYEENGELFLVAVHSTKVGNTTLNPTITKDIKLWVKNY